MRKRQPNLSEEKKLWRKGYQFVVGLDEAGRGALAGPVLAAAVTIKNPKFKAPNSKQIPITKIQNSKQKSFAHLKIGILDLFGICDLEFGILKLRDSKKLSPKQREKIYQLIIKNPMIEWGIGKASEKIIDKINILEATKLAMKRAIKNLGKKLLRKQKIASFEIYDREMTRRLDFLILDGKMKLDLPIPQKSIVKADEKVFSCACASVIAKVTRDRIMQRYHQKFPQYGFEKNKGYPTKYHFKMLKKYGPSKIHRKSFGPVLACQMR